MPMKDADASLFKEAFDIYDLQHETKKSKEKRDGTGARQKFFCHFSRGRNGHGRNELTLTPSCAQARSI